MMMQERFASAILSLTLAVWIPLPLLAETPSTRLQPLLAVPDEVALHDDFSKDHPLDKSTWQKRQGTRWTVEDGVLRGRPSSAEYQAKKKDHFGYEPRLSVPVTPAEFVATFSFRFIDGQETAIVPFIEFGHHVCRIRFGKDGIVLLADHETMKLAEANDFVWKSGQWYHALAEMKDGHFVMQIADGPTLYAQRDSFKSAPTSGGNGFGIAGPKHGMVELDELTLWTVKKQTQPNWASQRKTFPHFQPVQVKELKQKKKK